MHMPIAIALITAMMLGSTPPSGRPPIGPVQRVEPRQYEMAFTVTIGAAVATTSLPIKLELAETPILMPVLFMGSYSRVNSASLQSGLWLDGRSADPSMQIKSGLPFHMHLASLTVDQFRGSSIRWQVQYAAQVWSSRVDDEKAAQIPWPAEWPEEVRDGLLPQLFIESNDEMFTEAIRRIAPGDVRALPPYLAAKEIVRYVVMNVQPSGDGLDRADFGSVRGMLLNGASRAAHDGLGTPHDLVCVCVAMLRAAGIPARAVIGVEKDERHLREHVHFVSWAEFYLPEAGWIPFDPMSLRGRIRSSDARQPWADFGTMKDLNRRVPLSYHFMPPVTCESPSSPAVWGWDPRPGNLRIGLYQVQINLISRGRGEDDPP